MINFKFFQEPENQILLINWESIVGEQYPDEQFGRTPTTFRNITWDDLSVDLLPVFPYTISKLIYRGETFTDGWPVIVFGDKIDEVEVQIIYDKF